MYIIPAIDLIGGKAVRLQKGDYNKVTVYSDTPAEVANEFESKGARMLHVVDLDGAKDGTTANFDTVRKITESTSLSVEIGGGVRDIERVRRYIEVGVDRIIVGTAALNDPDFLREAIRLYGERIVVGVDIKDGYVAIKGWIELSDVSCFDLCQRLSELGVKTVIVTDISKDGMMSGTNIELYRELSERFDINIIASGGVSSLDDIKTLADMNIYGAILGKALYTGDVELSEAIEVAGGQR